MPIRAAISGRSKAMGLRWACRMAGKPVSTAPAPVATAPFRMARR